MIDERVEPIAHTGVRAAEGGASHRAALRILREVLGGGALAALDAREVERMPSSATPAMLIPVALLEDAERARLLPAASATAVRAFLDGLQRTRVLAHVDGVPIVQGTVAAVIRQRPERRLLTWRAPIFRNAVYAPRDLLGESAWHTLHAAGLPLQNLTSARGEPLVPHPVVIRERALQLVSAWRAETERELATAWCSVGDAPWLWIDGGLAGNLALDPAYRVFGVVKAHATLYGDASFVRRVLTLRRGERSAAFSVAHATGRTVTSWYLRLHAPQHGDPLHGLVRVETVPRPDVESHANLVSAWILAERIPLSLPDAHWDTLTYGVRDSQSYLAACLGA